MEMLLGELENQNVKTLGGKYLIFTLENASFGISILGVNEIIGLLEITPIPKSPPYLKGIINLRGKLIPVIDLRIKFEMNRKEYYERTCIIIVNSTEKKHKQIGLIVDMVSEVFNIKSSDIEPAIKFNNAISTNFLEGVGKIKDKAIMLLNITSLIE